ncbi:MAG TPA: thioredoxin domain-containing protein [Polyangiaceae bacterium]
MKKPISLVVLSVLALAMSACSHAVGTSNGPDPAPPAVAAQDAVPVYRVPVDGLPSIGKADALVTIVEFTDYQCPFCQKAEHTMVRLRATYGDSLRIVVAERPLPFHEHARPAALAALAASSQGKFEAMHERLFALGRELDDTAIASAALDSGVTLGAGVDDGSLARSEQLADRLGVHGTPTFFVGGRLVTGAQPYETFRDVVEERLAAARALVARGTAPGDVYATLVSAGRDHLDAEPQGDVPGCGQNCNDAPGDHPTPAVADTVDVVPVAGSPSRGPDDAPITIVAFSDFECPYCARATATLHAIESAHPGSVRIVFKNRPLPMHAHARDAAIAALAAGRQGRFWDFHDRVFARTGVTLDHAGLQKVAADLGLDVAQFSRDLQDPALAAQVARDDADADALAVKGTPTFFVNGRRVVGAQPATAFEAAIAKSR